MEKGIAMFYPERIKSIKSSDRVLEVGPGGTPFHRSNVLLEKIFDDEEARKQRGHVSALTTDKEIVYYEGNRFPFEDNEFDYVICSHVLEHIPSNEIVSFVYELVRVAKKGYLEFPTIYYEYLYNFNVHVTLLNYKKGILYYMDKETSELSRFYEVQKFFYKTLEHGYDEIIQNNKQYFFQGFEWSEKLELKSVDSIVDLIENNVELEQPKVTIIQDSRLIRLIGKIKKIKELFNLNYLFRYREYQKQFITFEKTHGQRFTVLSKDKYPCLNDKGTTTSFDKHYTYHTAWAARKLQEVSPIEHVDIASLTYFSTLVSAFIPVKFYDYRPAELELDNFMCSHADITALPFDSNTVKSLSCMHVVEHIGLGRYGDKIDVDGDLKAIEELKRVVASQGNLFFVVPIGKAKIMFNAHRIYSYDQIISYFQGFDLKEFTLIPDKSNEGLIVNAAKEESDMQDYACGCFWFQKR
jgi:predicted SAM-dependent methyltransferase